MLLHILGHGDKFTTVHYDSLMGTSKNHLKTAIYK